VKTEVSKSGK